MSIFLRGKGWMSFVSDGALLHSTNACTKENPVVCLVGVRVCEKESTLAAFCLVGRPILERAANGGTAGLKRCRRKTTSSSLSLPPERRQKTDDPLQTAAFPTPKWKRVLLKVSGEALGGPESSQGIDPETIQRISSEIASVVETGVEVAVVVGGGNYFRGKAMASAGLDRASADYVGMLATVMNAITLQAGLEARGIPSRVQTAIEMKEVAEPYIRRKAIRHLELGRVVIFGAGTGNPFFTTDTAAALRAAEIDAQAVLKATNVDGIFDCDPRKNSNANLLTRITYRRVALEGLSVMDATAITLCEENDLPVVVFNLRDNGNISRALKGEEVGSLVASKSYLEQL